MKKLSRSTAILAAMMIAFSSAAVALEPTVVTFDNGTEGWSANPDCETIRDDGGSGGAYWNFQNIECDTGWIALRAFFLIRNVSDPAFIGDYTAKGPVRISVDVNVNDFTWFWFGRPVEEYRQVVVEFIDWDNPYTSPETGHTWSYTSVMYPMGYLPDRNDGWKTFTLDIEDPSATEVPEGWTGYGGPEDPVTYFPQLPPGRTFADVMAEVDEIRFHSSEPGYFYDIGFTYELEFDNITIMELPRECDGQLATIWVDNDGIVHGGEYDGMPYTGDLTGTMSDDVIVGTIGDDVIQGLAGNDLICGREGNDDLHGHIGNDFILGGEGDDTVTGGLDNDFLHGGEGRDNLNGGPGSDTCIDGEVSTRCGE